MAEIPRFDPNVRIPSGIGARVSPGPDVGAAVVGLGQTITRAAKIVEEVERNKQDERDMNKLYAVLQAADLGMTDALLQNQRGEGAVDPLAPEAPPRGLSSDELKVRGDAAIKKHRAEAEAEIGKLGSQKARDYGMKQLGLTAHRHALGLVDDTDRRFVDESRSETMGWLARQKDMLINARTPEAFDQLRQQMVDRLTTAGGRTFTQQEATGILEKVDLEVRVENLKTRVRRFSGLEASESILATSDLPEHVKDAVREYRDAYVQRQVERDNQRVAAEQRQFEAQVEWEEIRLQELARTKTITKDQLAEAATRFRAPNGGPTLSSERLLALQKLLDDARKFESDGPMVKSIGLALQNATTVEQLQNILTVVDKAYLGDKINDVDFDKFSTRARTYAAFFRDNIRASYAKAHADVMEEINLMHRISPFLPSFDERSQAKEATIRDMNKASIVRGGDFDPRQWWAGYHLIAAGRMQDALEKKISVRVTDLPTAYRPATAKPGAMPTPAAVRAAIRSLDQAKGVMPAEEFLRQRDRLLDLHGMALEHERVFGITQQPKPATKPGAAPAPAKPQNTYGR